MTTRRWRLGIGAAICLALMACGYGLVGTTSTLPADIRNIYVAPLQNRTLRHQVDQVLTQAITEQFVQRRRYEVVNSRDAADAELVGAVTGFATTPVAFDQEVRASRVEVSITAALRLQRTSTPPQILWASDRYVFRRQYDTEPIDDLYIDQQVGAVEEVARDFAQTLVIDVLEQF